ncbi:MAG: 2-acylglycerophosphoethanolamine acyltransferase, partial [Gammaproteobacteria bacterium]|nr:2-acylglycerophosphoethanolamine acyltransferase [Gammaproteobacteria bacterium]
KVWPDALHAAVSIPDERKGEQVVLLTSESNAERSTLLKHAQAKGVAEINVPRQVITVDEIPVLGTGKIDYVSANQLVGALI